MAKSPLKFLWSNSGAVGEARVYIIMLHQSIQYADDEFLPVAEKWHFFRNFFHCKGYQ
jgi:hypothetical protein